MANALDLVRLSALMRLSAGRPEVVIALVDGPVALAHADLAGVRSESFRAKRAAAARRPIASPACMGPSWRASSSPNAAPSAGHLPKLHIARLSDLCRRS